MDLMRKGRQVVNGVCRVAYDRQIMGGACNAAWWQLVALMMLLTLSTHSVGVNALSKMQLVHTWGKVRFKFDSRAQQQQLEANGTYKAGASIPFDVDVHPRSGRVFVSIPNIWPGSSVTLATIEKITERDSPRLVPYPDWSWHAGARGCSGLTSVFRMQVDECDRLWAIDSGITEIASSFTRTCPAQLFVFDLKTNKLIIRHKLEKSDEGNCRDSLPLNVVVDQKGAKCSDDVYAYIADVTGFVLTVFHLRSKSSWRVQSYLFYPDVNSRVITAAGTEMTLMDGILGLALSPAADADERCGRLLHFHPMASQQEARVCTTALQNQTALESDPNAGGIGFIGRRDSQVAVEAFSKSGVLFFNPVNEYSINCWNYKKEYTKSNQPVVERDQELVRFVAGMKVIASGRKGEEELWAVANNAQLIFNGTWRYDSPGSVNILRGSVRALTAGSVCDRSVVRTRGNIKVLVKSP